MTTKRINERVVSGLRRFQPVLIAARNKDIGEADTVTIIKDILTEVFGYDKYNEITSEFAIRGTYCDLAIRLDSKLILLIEAKAIGIELKDSHVKQAVDYAANQGVDWVVLTNGLVWKVFHIIFAKPIDQELVIDVNLTELNPRSVKDLDTLYLLCKEAWQKSALGEYRTQRMALSRFLLGAIIQSPPVLEVVRRELRRVSPNVKLELDEIRSALTNEVIKREVLEGDKAVEASKKVSKAATKALRKVQLQDDPVVVGPGSMEGRDGGER